MPKIWLALFFGYNGQNFCGMQYQRQQSVISVQKLLIKTLHKQSFLATKNYIQLVKNYKLSRAARTDKGVHAILNAISCLFTISQQFYDESKTLQKNKLLVKLKEIFEGTDIIINGIRRVTNRFDIRQMVRARTYCYLCPSQYFAINNKDKQQLQNKQIHIQQPPQKQQIKMQKQNEILNQTKILVKINQCCKKFIGTHNFHNYSKNLKAKDPKARRYILQFECKKVNKKFYKFIIKGQSFVYHQIRKIIGCIIQIFLSEYQPQFIDNTFFNNQFYVPLAPPFGLYLRMLNFESYNKKQQIPEKIEFQNEEQSLQKLQKIIMEHIFKIQDKNWVQWYQKIREGVVPKFQEDQQMQDIVDDD